ncbi:MAG: glycerol-3-phosphate dehydrogenase C-terminal domain-containing protein [Vicinamibacterales bacterium]
MGHHGRQAHHLPAHVRAGRRPDRETPRASETRGRTADEPLLPPNEVTAFSAIVPTAFTRDAVEHYVRHEWARNLDDVLVRRSSWHYYHTDTEAQARRVAGWMAPLLNWSAETVEQELERYHGLENQSVHPSARSVAAAR